MNNWLDKLKHAKGIIVAIAGGGAVLSGLVGYYTSYQAVTASSASSAVITPTAQNAGPLSIVVLPFANQTGDAQKSYVADALTTSITIDLSRIRDAFVVSTTTALAYKDKAVTAQQVGKEVGARFALQGGVVANGNKVRISVQLADTQTGAQLWSETFDGDTTNLFALQDQITAKIGNSIGREMVITAARESVKKKTTPEVADLLMRVRALDWKPLTLETFQETEDLLRQVLARDPDNSVALARLASLLTRKATNFSTQIKPEDGAKMFAEADRLALKAEAIDPNNPVTYGVLSTIRVFRNDVEGAKRAAQKRLELSPKDPSSYNNMSQVSLREGNALSSAEYLVKGIDLDPKNPPPIMLHNLGCSYLYLGNDALAIEWLTKAIEKSPKLPPPRAALAAAYFHSGDIEKAKATAAELLRINPEFKISGMAQRTIAPKLWETKLLPYAKQAGLPE